MHVHGCAFQKHSENIKVDETCLVHMIYLVMKQKYIRKSISTYVYIVVVLLVKKVVIAIIIGPWDVDVQKICFVAYLERISFELFSSYSNLAYEPNYHL